MKSFIVFIVFLSFITAVSAEEKLVAISGLYLPPYIINETSGIEVDIVKTTLKQVGYDFDLSLVPFVRVRVNMEVGKADMAFPVNKLASMKNVYYSEPHITYQNVVISLKKNNLKVNNIEDLRGHSIVAFQDAKIYLGEEFKKMANDNKLYSEMAEQENQVAMLYKGRTEFLVMDKNIFKYFKQNSTLVNTNEEVEFHEIFDETNYSIAFKNKDIRDKFNLSLQKIKESGEYEKIIKKYIK